MRTDEFLARRWHMKGFTEIAHDEDLCFTLLGEAEEKYADMRC
jgi:hypothetical protein